MNPLLYWHTNAAPPIKGIFIFKNMESKHTPGPWKWVIHDKSMASLEGPRDEEDHVMSVSPCASCIGRSSEFKWGACTLPNAANAALIAAAPYLLEALKEIVKEYVNIGMEQMNNRDHFINGICSVAIAKAETV